MTTKIISSPHKNIILTKLEHQGGSNDCGPATAATVINSLRKTNLNSKALAQKMNKPRKVGILPIIRRIPDWMTFPWGMVDIFHEYGLYASWKINSSFDYLKESMVQGKIVMPIVGSWRPLWSHVMTLLVCSPGKHWGFANTQHELPEIFWVQDHIFRRQWRVMGNLLVEVYGTKDANK